MAHFDTGPVLTAMEVPVLDSSPTKMTIKRAVRTPNQFQDLS